MENNGLPNRNSPFRRRVLLWGIGACLGVIALLSMVWYATPTKAKPAADNTGVPIVAVANIERTDLAKELTLQAEFRPFQEIDLHAKVAGFLERIDVDVGDRVEAGQVLATLEVPELRDDLTHAQAVEKRSIQEVERADAGYQDAHLSFTRLLAVDKAQPHLIAQQDLDTAQTKDRSAASSLASAKDQVEISRADVDKLQTMLKYSRITAPFSGVITKRYADPGALIQAGTSSSTQAMPLVRLSQNDKLRLVFPVSVSFVSRIKLGDQVEIRVESLGRTLKGSITRFTRKVDTVTRTMDVEVDLPNPDLTLIPGIYATLGLKIDWREHVLAVPVEAVSGHQNVTVYLVNDQHQIEERAITLGLETPSRIEVLSGLAEHDRVMVGNRGLVRPGQKVVPKLIELAAKE